MAESMVNVRRVQLTGTSTLSVSLPKDWVKRYRISKGFELSVSEANDGSLIVSAAKAEKKSSEAVLAVSEEDGAEETRRKFLAMYLAGFNVIRVSAQTRFTPELRKAVISETRRLIGVEATEESQNEILVQDFFSHEGLSVSKTLNRAHLITSTLYEDLLKALCEDDLKLAENVVSRDDEVDRLRFLLLRQLNLALHDASLLRKLDLTASDCVGYATIVRLVERIADKINKIARLYCDAGSGKKSAALKKINDLNREAFEAYSASLKSFLARDANAANQVIAKKQEVFKKRNELEKDMLKHAAPFQYGIILDTVAGIAEDAAEIAETTINQSAAST